MMLNKNFDWLILGCIIFIFSLGLTILYSVASRELVFHQLLYFGIGLILFFLFAKIDYRIFQNLSLFLYVFSVFFLLLTFLLGKVTRGAVRWISLGPFTLQPSELVKPWLVLFFSSLMANSKQNDFKKLLLSLGGAFLPAFLIFKQPALGSTLVVLAGWWGIVIASGFSWLRLLLLLIMGLFSLPVGWFFLQDYQKLRLKAFLHPFSDPLGSGYNLIQSVVSVGSGQFWGRGLGQGTQSHLRFLPENQTDFIFASLAEELGFVGSFLLLLAFSLLFWRLLVIAQRTKDKFGFLVCVGVFSFLLIQFFINLGMNLGLTPITGITLPLVSYGGSSLVATLISLGVVESIAQQRNLGYNIKL